MTIPPPPKQIVLSLVVKHLHLKVPQWVGLVVLAIALPTGAWMALGDSRGGPLVGPLPLPVPQVPLQGWTTSATMDVATLVLAATVPDKPGPNQKRAGTCDPGRSEVAIGGGCWVKTDHPRPCPEGKQWEYQGRCWLPVAEAKPVPTTGDPRPAPVAGPDD